jgi:hypothetical protein
MFHYQVVPDAIGATVAMLITVAGIARLAWYKWDGVLLLAAGAAAGSVNAVLFGSALSRSINGPGLAVAAVAALGWWWRNRRTGLRRPPAGIRSKPTPWHSFWNWLYGYQAVCIHRSHVLHLPCFRWRVYGGYCSRHNASCPGECS